MNSGEVLGLKFQKQLFLVIRKSTRLTQEEETVVSDVGKSKFFEAVINTVC